MYKFIGNSEDNYIRQIKGNSDKGLVDKFIFYIGPARDPRQPNEIGDLVAVMTIEEFYNAKDEEKKSLREISAFPDAPNFYGLYQKIEVEPEKKEVKKKSRNKK